MRVAVIRIFERYVAAHVIVATLLSLLVLLALFLFVSVVDDLGRVGRGDYTVLRSLEYVALSAPRLAFSLFPVAAVIGSLLGLGILAANSELVVLRSSGISVVEITGAVLKAGALLMIAVLLVGEFVAPFAEALAEQRRADAIAGYPESGNAPGFWARDGNSFINVRDGNPGERMEQVFIYEFDEERRLRVATRAAEASYRDGIWHLRDVVQTRFDGERVTGRRLERARWESQFEPDMVNLVALRPGEPLGARTPALHPASRVPICRARNVSSSRCGPSSHIRSRPESWCCSRCLWCSARLYRAGLGAPDAGRGDTGGQLPYRQSGGPATWALVYHPAPRAHRAHSDRALSRRRAVDAAALELNRSLYSAVLEHRVREAVVPGTMLRVEGGPEEPCPAGAPGEQRGEKAGRRQPSRAPARPGTPPKSGCARPAMPRV